MIEKRRITTLYLTLISGILTYMKRFLTLIILLGLLVSPRSLSAQRLAECDACGYCLQRQAPGNWGKCAQCLYPLVNPADPTSNQTLEIKYPFNTPPTDETEKFEQGRQVTPAPGKYYTQLGCINTSLSSFSDPAASGGVLNFLLNRFIFPIAGALAFIFIVYGSFLLVTAQGSSEQIARGRLILTGAIIGLIFTLSAVLLIQIIANNILKIPGFT
jgi:hypothetical protein